MASIFALPRADDANCSALALSDSLQPEARESRDCRLQTDLEQFDLDCLRKASGPMKSVRQLAKANECGADINSHLTAAPE